MQVSRLCSYLLLAAASLIVVPRVFGQVIDTFAISDLQPRPDDLSRPVVGANGDLW